MSISLDEVRRIAALVRLGLDESQMASMAAELSSILDHMTVLARADTSAVAAGASDSGRAIALRADVGPPIALARMPDDFAPVFRGGFFLVPRLSTHEDVESAS